MDEGVEDDPAVVSSRSIWHVVASYSSAAAVLTRCSPVMSVVEVEVMVLAVAFDASVKKAAMDVADPPGLITQHSR